MEGMSLSICLIVRYALHRQFELAPDAFVILLGGLRHPEMKSGGKPEQCFAPLSSVKKNGDRKGTKPKIQNSIGIGGDAPIQFGGSALSPGKNKKQKGLCYTLSGKSKKCCRLLVIGNNVTRPPIWY